MLLRETDADMRRDGSRTAQSVETPPSMSAEECTAHHILKAEKPYTDVQRAVQRRVASSAVLK